MTDDEPWRTLKDFIKTLADQGRLVEACFTDYFSEPVSPAQLKIVKTAFYAGAQHMLLSIVTLCYPAEKTYQRGKSPDRSAEERDGEIPIAQMIHPGHYCRPALPHAMPDARKARRRPVEMESSSLGPSLQRCPPAQPMDGGLALDACEGGARQPASRTACQFVKPL